MMMMMMMVVMMMMTTVIVLSGFATTNLHQLHILALHITTTHINLHVLSYYPCHVLSF